MPDAHQGYGFCIGGVAAADLEEGVVSAGGVGFDINCGVRLLASPLTVNEVRPHLEPLLNQLFREIPCGTGRRGLQNLDKAELDQVLLEGSHWVVQQGYGNEADLAHIEEIGKMPKADASLVSQRAKERGHDQLGTLGSGNHFLEIQVVAEIFDPDLAERFGLHLSQIVVLMHSGSRGLGHQVCTDYLDLMQASGQYRISVIDRQLACVPIRSGRAGISVCHGCSGHFAFATADDHSSDTPGVSNIPRLGRFERCLRRLP